MLDHQTFLSVVSNAPLISIDLILMSGKKILLGLRKNSPAKGFWFVPGGRILKNETISKALLRIADKELSIGALIENGQLDVTFYGTYEHFYDDCFAEEAKISTHYVVLAHKIDLPENVALPPTDEQHLEFKWWSINELLNAENVHQYSKNYFIDNMALVGK